MFHCYIYMGKKNILGRFRENTLKKEIRRATALLKIKTVKSDEFSIISSRYGILVVTDPVSTCFGLSFSS